MNAARAGTTTAVVSDSARVAVGRNVMRRSMARPEAQANRCSLQSERGRDLIRKVAMVARMHARGDTGKYDDCRRPATHLGRVVNAGSAALDRRRLLRL